MTRIEEFSDDELIDELCRRYDSYVFAGRKTDYKGPGTASRRRFYKGDLEVCVGLVMGVQHEIIEKVWGK